MNYELFAEVDSFNAGGDGGENLVRDGFHLFGHFGYGQCFVEEDDWVAFFCFDAGDVDHAGIHAYIADYRAAYASDKRLAYAIAEQAIQSIGITDGEDGYRRITFDECLTSITDGVAGRYAADLEDDRFEGTDVL